MTFTRVIFIVAITAVLVYFGLDLVMSGHKKEEQTADGPSTDQVFDNDTSSADNSAPVAPAASDTATLDSAAPGATAAEPAPATAAVESAPAAGASAAAQPSNEAAEAEPAPAATSDNATSAASAPAIGGGEALTEAEARRIAEDVGRRVGEQVARSVVNSQSGAQSGGGSNLSEDEIRRIAREEARKANLQPPPREPRTKSGTAVASSAPKKPARAASGSAQTGATHTLTKPSGSKPPAADVVNAWWPAADKQSSDRLNLLYAGEVANEHALALLFSSNVDPAAAGDKIQVLSKSGQRQSGSWEAGSNPRMLVFRTSPGRYTVILPADLADSSGKSLGMPLNGPIYVH
jgi:hypothetical protein